MIRCLAAVLALGVAGCTPNMSECWSQVSRDKAARILASDLRTRLLEVGFFRPTVGLSGNNLSIDLSSFVVISVDRDTGALRCGASLSATVTFPDKSTVSAGPLLAEFSVYKGDKNTTEVYAGTMATAQIVAALVATAPRTQQ